MDQRDQGRVSKPLTSALEIKRFSASITIMKSIGERASPCRSPRGCQTDGPGAPLSRMVEEAVDKIIAIQALHLGPKHLARRMSSKTYQATVSKSFTVSEFDEKTATPFLSDQLDSPVNQFKVIVERPVLKKSALVTADNL